MKVLYSFIILFFITTFATKLYAADPVITSNGGGDNAAVSVPENTTPVTTVTATDADAGTTIIYSISGGADAGFFNINASTGALSFILGRNFENPADADANNTYIVTVRASDGVNFDEQTITVSVTNVNDNQPIITSNGAGTTAAISVSENTTAVTTVTAFDADAGTTMIYSISGGADVSRFSINSSTGVLTFITPPNFEAPADADGNNTYIVIVRAADSPSGGFFDSQTITVTVTNINDAPTLDAIPDKALTMNAGTQTVNLSGIADADGNTQVLTVTATSTNTALIPDPNVTYTSPNATGSLSFTPASNVTGTSTITVTVTDNGGTANGGVNAVVRTFQVTVTNSLPLNLVSLKVYQSGNEILLDWITSSEMDLEKYEVEKSKDGINFSTIGAVAARGNSSVLIYNWPDVHPFTGDNFYRLKMIDKNGQVRYSPVVKVSIGSKGEFIKVNPNPVTDKTLGLQLNNLSKGRYQLMLYDSKGHNLFSRSIDHIGGSQSLSIQLPSLISSGIYRLRMTNNKDVYNIPVIIK